jgi:hypothetical protein
MTTDPIIFGGATPSGHEEPPQLRYETTDKSGVTEVTAVISRRIHCLATYAPAIVQSASFPGQVLTINGTSYGAGWEIGSVSQTPEGAGGAIVAFECRRTGITPFEWSMPPGLSMEAENGIASLFYRPPGGDKIEMMRWDAGTGENRYGWKVNYPRETWGFGCEVLFENARQYYISGLDAMKSVATEYGGEETKSNGGPGGLGYETSAAALAAGEAALPAFLSELEAKIAEDGAFQTRMIESGSNYYFTPPRLLVRIDSANASVSVKSITTGFLNRTALYWVIRVPAVHSYTNWPAMQAEMRRGLRWESVADMDAESATYQHIFYRLVYAGTVFFAIDVTAATPPEEP